jgi:GNAT superfamily N-acetyltransferase
VTTATTKTKSSAARTDRLETTFSRLAVTASMYDVREQTPAVDDFLRLRAAAGMSERSREAVERGLPNSQYAVVVVHRPDEGVSGETEEDVVGMARVVGDGGTIYHVCDMVVHPDHQRQGLGTKLMDAIMEWLAETAPPGAYVNLMADVDGFYEQWGFEPTLPASRGMYYRVGAE